MSRMNNRRAVGLVATAAAAALAVTPGAAVSATGDNGADSGANTSQDGLAPVTGTSANDRYIVVFDTSAQHSTLTDARAAVKAQGGDIYQNFRSALDGFAAELPGDALTDLRKNPGVAYIEPDRVITTSETETDATWGIDRTDQRELPLDNEYTFEESGAGVTAYIIDTGIQASHEEFSGRVTSGYSAIDDGNGTEDCQGHGSHVAGTVGGETYGIAQDVDLVAVRVLGCDGSGSTSGVIAGVDWVTQNADGPSVANMSLGGGASQALDDAVANSISEGGVTYAVAAGNDYGADACASSPASVEPALTVGSTADDDSRSDFSNIGSCLDIFAPGTDITSAWIGSDTATDTISGTSMATPHVAGVAAVYLEANPDADPAAVSEALVSNATPDVVGDPGTGSPNLLLYSNFE